jgi:hypothetical protein
MADPKNDGAVAGATPGQADAPDSSWQPAYTRPSERVVPVEPAAPAPVVEPAAPAFSLPATPSADLDKDLMLGILYGDITMHRDRRDSRSIDQVVDDVARTAGVDPIEYRARMVNEGVGVEDFIARARGGKQTYEQYVEEARKRGVRAFLPPEEREKAAAADRVTRVDPESLTRGDLKGNTGSPDTWDLTAGLFDPSENVVRSQVAQEGETTFEASAALLRLVQREHEDILEIVDAFGADPQGVEAYIAEVMDRRMSKTGLTPGTEEYDAKANAERNRAIREITAWKTIGLWQGPAFLPLPDDVKRKDGVLGDGMFGDVLSAMAPRMEIMGFRADGTIQYRSHSGLNYAADLLDTAGAAATGVVRYATGVGEGSGYADGRSLGEEALHSIARRDNPLDYTMETESFKSALATYQKSEPGSYERRVAAAQLAVMGGAGFGAAVLMPDALSLAGPGGYVAGAARKAARVRGLSTADTLTDALSLLGATKTATARLPSTDRALTRATADLANAARVYDSGDKDAAYELFEEAAKVEAQLRRRAGGAFMEQVDAVDTANLAQLAHEYEKLPLGGDVEEMSRIVAALPGEEAQALLGLSPGARRARLKSKSEGGVQFAGHENVYNFADNLRRLDKLEETISGGGDDLARALAVAPFKSDIKTRSRLARLNNLNDMAVKAGFTPEAYGRFIADLDASMVDILIDPAAWSAQRRLDVTNRWLPGSTPEIVALRHEVHKTIGSIEKQAKAFKASTQTEMLEAVQKAREATLLAAESRAASMLLARQELRHGARLSYEDVAALNRADIPAPWRETERGRRAMEASRLSGDAQKARAELREFGLEAGDSYRVAVTAERVAEAWATRTGRPAADWWQERWPQFLSKKKAEMDAAAAADAAEDAPTVAGAAKAVNGVPPTPPAPSAPAAPTPAPLPAPGQSVPVQNIPALPKQVETADAGIADDITDEIPRPAARQADPAPAPSLVPKFALPPDLSKIAPRYGYRDANFNVKFDDDYDRAAYTLASDERTGKKSQAHDRIVSALESAGFSVADATAHGRIVAARLKAEAATAHQRGERKGTLGLSATPRQDETVPAAVPTAPVATPPAAATPAPAASAPASAPAPAPVAPSPAPTAAPATFVPKHLTPTLPTNAEGWAKVNKFLKTIKVKITAESDGTLSIKIPFITPGQHDPPRAAIESVGGRWNPDRNAWSVPADRYGDLAPKLFAVSEEVRSGKRGESAGSGGTGRGAGGAAGGVDGGVGTPESGDAGSGADGRRPVRSGQAVGAKPVFQHDDGYAEKRRAVRAGPDRRSGRGDVSALVHPSVRNAIVEGGRRADIPDIVTTEQVEDAGAIIAARRDGQRGFVLASEPGTGKTFVMAAAIRGMLDDGAQKIVYVTMNNALVDQIKADMTPLGVDMDRVEVITYARLQKYKAGPTDAVFFDEAHNAKNLEGSRGKRGLALARQSKFVVYASATPFKNPSEAQYIVEAGLFSDDFANADDFAYTFGATKVKKGDKEVAEYRRHEGTNEDLADAREYMVKRGMFSARQARIPGDMVDSRLVNVDGDPKIAARYEAFERAAESASTGEARLWCSNKLKRLAEESKIDTAIDLARQALDEGRFPVIFIETRSESVIDIPQIIKQEAVWQAQARAARMSGGDVPKRSDMGLPPEGATEVLAAYMEDTGESVLRITSAEDAVRAAFGPKTAVYTGSVSDPRAKKNLAAWREGKKPVMVVTMARGGTGLSLHDKVGNHPTTHINLTLPWSAEGVAQVAQRTVRYGLKSKAKVMWLFDSSIPMDVAVASRCGERMADMSRIVVGSESEMASRVAAHDFEVLTPDARQMDAARVEDAWKQAEAEAQPVVEPDTAAVPAPAESKSASKRRMYQGRGASAEDVYGPRAVAEGRAAPLFGRAQYYADDPSLAATYGDVTEHEVELRNPMVLDDDRKWVALMRDAGAENLDSKGELFYSNPQGVPAAGERVQEYLRSRGYDGIVVRLDEEGDSTQRLADSAGHNQVVVFESPAVAEPVITAPAPAPAPIRDPVSDERLVGIVESVPEEMTLPAGAAPGTAPLLTRDLVAVLEALLPEASDATKALLPALLPLLKGTRISVVDDLGDATRAMNARVASRTSGALGGFYSSDHHQVVIPRTTPTSVLDSRLIKDPVEHARSLEAALLHEVVHAATSRAIHTAKHGAKGAYAGVQNTPELVAAYRNLESLQSDVITALRRASRGGKGSDPEMAALAQRIIDNESLSDKTSSLGSVSEFLAYALTDTDRLQTFMRSTPASVDGVSLWEGFKRALRDVVYRAIGRDPSAQEATLFDKLLDLTDPFLAETKRAQDLSTDPLLPSVVKPSGAPAQAPASAPASAPRTKSIRDSEGNRYAISDDVADLTTAVASNAHGTFRPETQYPADFQARTLDTPEERAKIERIAQTLDPERVLADNLDATQGAPVVWRDPSINRDVVLAGNGRWIAILMAPQEKYDAYADAAGLPVDGNRRIRVRRLEGATREEAKRLAALSQESAAGAQTRAGKALGMARGMGLTTTPPIRWTQPITASNVGDFAKANPDFYNAVMDGVESARRAGIAANPAMLAERMNAALIGTNPAVVARPNIAADPAVEEAVMGALPALNTLSTAIAAGRVDKSYDVAEDMGAALDLLDDMRRKNQSFAAMARNAAKSDATAAEDAAKVQNVFAVGDTRSPLDTASPRTVALAGLLYNASKRAAPEVAASEMLTAFVRAAEEGADPRRMGLFGAPVIPDAAGTLADQVPSLRPLFDYVVSRGKKGEVVDEVPVAAPAGPNPATFSLSNSLRKTQVRFGGYVIGTESDYDRAALLLVGRSKVNAADAEKELAGVGMDLDAAKARGNEIQKAIKGKSEAVDVDLDDDAGSAYVHANKADDTDLSDVNMVRDVSSRTDAPATDRLPLRSEPDVVGAEGLDPETLRSNIRASEMVTREVEYRKNGMDFTADVRTRRLRDVVAMLTTEGASPITRAIANAVLPLIDDTTAFSMVREARAPDGRVLVARSSVIPHSNGGYDYWNNLFTRNENAAGLYSLSTDQVIVREKYTRADGAVRTGLSEPTIMHEVVHAASVKALRAVRDYKADPTAGRRFGNLEVTDDLIAASDDLDRLRRSLPDAAKKILANPDDYSVDAYVAATRFDALRREGVSLDSADSVEEFVAYALTNTDMVAAIMREVPWAMPGGVPSAWEGFKAAIRRLISGALGRPLNSEETTAFDALLDASERLFREQSRQGFTSSTDARRSAGAADAADAAGDFAGTPHLVMPDPAVKVSDADIAAMTDAVDSADESVSPAVEAAMKGDIQLPTVFRKEDYDIRPIDKDVANEILNEWHYAGHKGKNASYPIGIYLKGQDTPVGVALWGVPPSPAIGDYTAKMFDATPPLDPRTDILYLARVALRPGMPPNSASYLVGQSLRQIQADNVAKARRGEAHYRVAVTFADARQGHTGQVYKATNWIYDGKSPANASWIDADGRQIAKKSGGKNHTAAYMDEKYTRLPRSIKFRFFYPLDRKVTYVGTTGFESAVNAQGKTVRRPVYPTDADLPAWVREKKAEMQASGERFTNTTRGAVEAAARNDAADAAGDTAAPLYQSRGADEIARIDFDAEGRAIVTALQEPDITTAIHEIGHVLRRDLSAAQERIVVKWCNDHGIKVSAENGRFVGSAAAVEMAEELFARGVEKYLRDHEVPAKHAGMRAVWESVRKSMSDIYHKYAQTTALDDVKMSDEVLAVFRAQFDAYPPSRPGMLPRITEAVKSAFRRNPPAKRYVGLAEVVVQEARRLGAEVTVTDLDGKVTVAADADDVREAITEGWTINTDIPVLGYLGDSSTTRLGTAEQAKFELAVLERANTEAMEVGARAPIDTARSGVQEADTLGALRAAVAPSEDSDASVARKITRAGAQAAVTALFGMDPDAVGGLDLLPPAARAMVRSGTRPIEQAVADAIRFIRQEPGATADPSSPLHYFLGGEHKVPSTTPNARSARGLEFDDGRQVISSGTDFYKGSMAWVREFFLRGLTEDERMALSFFAEKIDDVRRAQGGELRMDDDLMHMLAMRGNDMPNIGDKTRSQVVARVVMKVMSSASKQQPMFVQHLATAMGYYGNTPAPREIMLVEILAYHAGITQRGRQNVSALASGASSGPKMAYSFLNDISRVYDPSKASHAAVIMAAHGAVQDALNVWTRNGIRVGGKVRAAFVSFVKGEPVPPDMVPQVRRLVDRLGMNPNLVNDMGVVDVFDELENATGYIPDAARARLAEALGKALLPEQANPNLKRGVIGDALRNVHSYMKKRWTRGAVGVRTTYFLNSTVDHVVALSITPGAGFRAAARSGVQVAAQAVMAVPFGGKFVQAVGAAARAAGGKGADRNIARAAEAFREILGATADAASSFLVGARYDNRLNKTLAGADGTTVINGRRYAFADIRRIAVEEGVMAGWDVSLLRDSLDQELKRHKRVVKGGKTGVVGRVGAALGGTGTPGERAADAAVGALIGIPESGYNAILGVYNGMADMTADMAEAWGERERLAAMLTIMEIGADPRTAGRIAVKALYDYPGSMRQEERTFLVSILFPFWAFQKNANAQVFNYSFSAEAAYRMSLVRHAAQYGTDLLTEAMYATVVDPYGLDVRNMPPELREKYFAFRNDLEFGMGDFDDMTDAERAVVEQRYGPIAQMDADMADFVQFGYGGTAMVPEDVRTALRMIFSHKERDIDDFRAGEGDMPALSVDALNLASSFRADMRAQEGVDADGNPVYANLSDFYIEKPRASGRSSYTRDRYAVTIPASATAEMRAYWSAARHHGLDQPAMMTLMPETVMQAGYRHLIYTTAVAVTAGMAGAGAVGFGPFADVGSDYYRIADTMAQVVDPAKSPIIAAGLEMTGAIPTETLAPRRIPMNMVDALKGMGFDHVVVTEGKVDPMQLQALAADPAMRERVRAAQKEYEATGEITDTELRGVVVARTPRAYIPGGVSRLALESTPGAAEFFDLMLKMETDPTNEFVNHADLLQSAKAIIGLQTAPYSPNRSALSETTRRDKSTTKPPTGQPQ